MKHNNAPITPAEMQEIQKKTFALAQAAADAARRGDHEQVRYVAYERV